MDKMVAKLDNIYPKLRRNKLCYFCSKPSTEIHHIVRRDNLILRFDLYNLLPLCNDCHRLIHDKGMDVMEYLPWARVNYLQSRANVQIKDYLLIEGLTKEDFFKQKEKELLEEICNA